MIVVRLHGGLGNQMFQYALGRHLALKNDMELFIDTTYFDHIPHRQKYFVKREYDLDIFNIKANLLPSKEAGFLPCYSSKLWHKAKHQVKKRFNLYEKMNAYKILSEKLDYAFDPTILGSGQNVYLIGYWQNEKYFKDIKEEISREFTFKGTFNVQTYRLAKEISDCNSLCLNIRRGDYINNPTHGFTGTEYINQAVETLRKKVDIQKIYIFSDDMDWCRQNLSFDVPHSFVTQDYAGPKFSSYLYLMTQCRHFVIPNSTFGWWGAWLSGYPQKIVIAPKRWVGVPGLDTSGIIPEGWITM